MQFHCVSAVFIFSCCIFCNALVSMSDAAYSKNSPHNQRPNLILILTDDQDSLLGSMDVMPYLRHHLIQKGADMKRAFVTTPVCCPSRSSLLTGMYVHNHFTFTNNANCTSPYWQDTHEPFTFGKMLNDAGYRTAYVGKYLNKYDGSYVPTGWDYWVGQVKNSRFYNYSVNENDDLLKHGWNYTNDYFTDLVTNRSLSFLNDLLRADERKETRRPFLLVASYPAPHGPEDSAPQYQSLFANNTKHRTESYNFAPNPDKEWLLRRMEPMSWLHERFTDILQQKRLQTLQSVDDGVRRLMEWLDANPQLGNNTYTFYTSDHGYHLGQFGLLKGKATPYEFDIRVPLIIRGPGVTAGSSSEKPVLNIDLAPTLLDLAGVAPSRPMDGDSMAPLLLQQHQTGQPTVKPQAASKTRWRRSFLVERGKLTTRKLSLRMQLETAISFDKAERVLKLCDQHDVYTLSCDLGDRFHCVPIAHQPGEYQKEKCPPTACRCKRSVVLPVSQYVWKHCWLQPQHGADPSPETQPDDGAEPQLDAADQEGSRSVRCQYSSLSDWLRDKRMMRMTQRKLDAIQRQLNQMRKAMRRNKGALMRLKSCPCRGGKFLRSRVEDLPGSQTGAGGLAGLLGRRRRRRRGERKNQRECKLKFMNCFFHDKSHWKTPPLWTEPSICFCGNANNYTYWCMRTVDANAESLYCEFITGFISYYNMTTDPNQLVNRVTELTFEQRSALHADLKRLRTCSGRSCSEFDPAVIF